MRALCDRQLRRWFLQYNLRYFDNRLSYETDLFYAPHPGCSGLAMQDEAAGPLLLINPGIAVDMKAVRLTLLHEMTHFDVGLEYGHGATFQAGMLRLAIAGALRNIW